MQGNENSSLTVSELSKQIKSLHDMDSINKNHKHILDQLKAWMNNLQLTE